jgi:hypothetical protein
VSKRHAEAYPLLSGVAGCQIKNPRRTTIAAATSSSTMKSIWATKASA